MVLRFVKGQFFEYQESTIGAAFLTQTVATSDATVKFEIWDTAGQERYHSLAPMYYRGAAAAIIVYDITSQASYARAKTWVRELQRQGNADLVMALAGNKSDMADERQVTAEEASAYAEENGLHFVETSAKTAANVNDLFYEIARKLPGAAPAQGPAPGRPERAEKPQAQVAVLRVRRVARCLRRAPRGGRERVEWTRRDGDERGRREDAAGDARVFFAPLSLLRADPRRHDPLLLPFSFLRRGFRFRRVLSASFFFASAAGPWSRRPAFSNAAECAKTFICTMARLPPHCEKVSTMFPTVFPRPRAAGRPRRSVEDRFVVGRLLALASLSREYLDHVLELFQTRSSLPPPPGSSPAGAPPRSPSPPPSHYVSDIASSVTRAPERGRAGRTIRGRAQRGVQPRRAPRANPTHTS